MSGNGHNPTPASVLQASDGIPRHRKHPRKEQDHESLCNNLQCHCLTAIAFGADAYAAMPAAATASQQQIENTITKLSPNAYNVIRLDSLRTHDTAKEQYGNVMPTSQEARLVQASVIANRRLPANCRQTRSSWKTSWAPNRLSTEV